jgi:uncharacterized zinc-type alcohol dehydrogenase-like protein
MATTTVKAYGATASTEDLKPLDIERRAVGTDDVKLISLIVVFVIVTYIQQETNGMDQPIVPGHEIIGRVVEVGNGVTSHKVGDLVGVGCMVDSCQPVLCKQDLEQFCENGATFTYNSPDKHLETNLRRLFNVSSC